MVARTWGHATAATGKTVVMTPFHTFTDDALGTETDERDGGQLLGRRGRVDGDVGRVAPHGADHDVAGEVQHLGAMDLAATPDDLRGIVGEGAIEGHDGVGHLDDHGVAVGGREVDVAGRQRRRDGDPVADLPPCGLLDDDRPIPLTGRRGQPGPRRAVDTVEVESAGAHGVEATGIGHHPVVAAHHLAGIEAGEGDHVELVARRSHGERAQDLEPPGRLTARGGVDGELGIADERERPRGLAPQRADRHVAVEHEIGVDDGCSVGRRQPIGRPGGGVAERRGRGLRERRRGRNRCADGRPGERVGSEERGRVARFLAARSPRPSDGPGDGPIDGPGDGRGQRA